LQTVARGPRGTSGTPGGPSPTIPSPFPPPAEERGQGERRPHPNPAQSHRRPRSPAGPEGHWGTSRRRNRLGSRWRGDRCRRKPQLGRREEDKAAPHGPAKPAGPRPRQSRATATSASYASVQPHSHPTPRLVESKNRPPPSGFPHSMSSLARARLVLSRSSTLAVPVSRRPEVLLATVAREDGRERHSN